jgi:phenylacetate-coenzyme A ligase PaaK-like adenylate-forming protein
MYITSTGGISMIETAYTMLKISLCRTLGWEFSQSDLRRLLHTAIRDYEIFGEPSNVTLTSIYTAEEIAYLQKRWLKKTLTHCKNHVPFYKNRISEELLQNFELERMKEIPLTTKKDIKEYSPQFIADDIDYLTLYSSSSGTTGSPTEFYLSKKELDTWNYLQAIAGVGLGLFLPGDHIQYNVPLSAQPDTFSFNVHCNLVGCLAVMQGIVPPESAVASLAKKRVIKGEQKKINMIFSLPSYLMKIVTTAKASGYSSNDFDVERIFYVGEVMPDRDKKEIAEFFEADMYAAYGSTEIVPTVANLCEHGNFHFDESGGYVELLDVTSKEKLVTHSNRGILTVTPYYPMRKAVPTVRYWTNDMVEKVVDCGCGTSENGGVYKILGRANYNVKTQEKIITQLELLNTASSVAGVVRPVRLGVHKKGEKFRIALEVTEKKDNIKKEIKKAYTDLGVPVYDVELYTNSSFEHIPLRSENEIVLKRGDAP